MAISPGLPRAFSRVRASAVALVLAALVVLTATAVGAQSATAADDDEPGSGLTVDVKDDATPSPTPRPSSSGAGSGPPNSPGGTPRGSGGSGAGTSNTPGGTPAGDPPGTPPADTSLPGAQVDLGVGGLSASISPSFEFGAGSVTLSVGVRNSSDEPYNGSARFWLTNIFGMTLTKPVTVPVDDLASNKAREVSAVLRDPGQWLFTQGHMTLTPSQEVDAASTVATTSATAGNPSPSTRPSPSASPTLAAGASTATVVVERDSFVLVPPLFTLAALLLAAGLGYGVWWMLRRNATPALGAVRFGE